MQSMYDRKQVEPMWRELDGIGVQPLTSSEQVDRFLSEKEGTSLIVVNSVCGCAAGTARPGVAIALQNKVIPDRMGTVFAGVDIEATARAREHLVGVPPSSPSVGLFKDGKLVFFLPRQEIEGKSEEQVAARLITAFNQFCAAEGPSVTVEQMKRAFGVGGPN
jgi:putative YphP/YqiW family bacilliredoxin